MTHARFPSVGSRIFLFFPDVNSGNHKTFAWLLFSGHKTQSGASSPTLPTPNFFFRFGSLPLLTLAPSSSSSSSSAFLSFFRSFPPHIYFPENGRRRIFLLFFRLCYITTCIAPKVIFDWSNVLNGPKFGKKKAKKLNFPNFKLRAKKVFVKVIFFSAKLENCFLSSSNLPSKKRSDFQTLISIRYCRESVCRNLRWLQRSFLFILLNLTEIAALPITNMEKKKKNSTPPPLFLSTLGCGRRKRRRKSQLRRRKRRGEGRNCENARRLRIYGKGKGEGEVIPGMESKYVRRGMPPRDIIVPYG